MNTRVFFAALMLASLASLGGAAHEAWAQPAIVAGDEVQVLTRGPVHEAFAEIITYNPEPGIVVTQAPPEAIEELPPDERPEGHNVTWIPGYWAWDDDQDTFLWVSGVWRDLPPGRQWVPGYWLHVGLGYQWISGYWADAAADEIVYLPEPPDSLEVGPSIAPPARNLCWVPGCWVWHHGRYAWRPGYWAAGRANWVWVPAHYTWTPIGYVFTEGYWDYAMPRRGVLFAPVYFTNVVYTRQTYVYSPSYAINVTVFSSELFVRPRYQHYYFGDYYDVRYQDAGFFASFSYQSSRHGYDPIFAHQRWEHRRDGEWERRVEAEFRDRREHEDARPPRTLAAQMRAGEHEARPKAKGFAIAVAFAQLAKAKESPLKFQPVAKEEKKELVRREQEMQKFRQERQKAETKAAHPEADKKTAKPSEPAKVTLPKSPVVAKPVAPSGKDQAPPKNHNVPQPDTKVEPKHTPKAEPKVEPKDKPKEEPKHKPKTEPKDKPKEEPKDKPKAEPKDKPKAEPKDKPKAEPKDKPKEEPKDKPKEEPKDKSTTQPKDKPKGKP